eukprot:4519259-Pyramimonas_sp.AAC.1
MASFTMNTASPCALRSAGVARQSGQTALLRGTPVKPAQTARIQVRATVVDRGSVGLRNKGSE